LGQSRRLVGEGHALGAVGWQLAAVAPRVACAVGRPRGSPRAARALRDTCPDPASEATIRSREPSRASPVRRSGGAARRLRPHRPLCAPPLPSWSACSADSRGVRVGQGVRGRGVSFFGVGVVVASGACLRCVLALVLWARRSPTRGGGAVCDPWLVRRCLLGRRKGDRESARSSCDGRRAVRARSRRCTTVDHAGERQHRC
jgi:hypothetical protein